MKYPVLSLRETIKSRRGSTLAAALALALLVFMITCASLARVAASWTQVGVRHRQSSALFLAEAGIQDAAHNLLKNKSYAGERGIIMPTGNFDTKIDQGDGGYIVTSTGHVKSPIKTSLRKTIQAKIVISGSGSFKIMDWREDP